MEKIRVLTLLMVGSFVLTQVLGCARGRGQVLLVNKTGVTVKEGKFQVGHEVFAIEALEAGGTVRFRFQSSDCDRCEYRVGLTLGDHRTTVQTIGVLRRGIDYDDSLTLEGNRLLLESRQHPSGNDRFSSISTVEKGIQWVSTR